MSTLNESQRAMMSDFFDAVRKLHAGKLGIRDFKEWVASLAWEATMRSNAEAVSLLWGIRSILSEWEDAKGEITPHNVADALFQEIRDCGLEHFLFEPDYASVHLQRGSIEEGWDRCVSPCLP